MTEGASTHAVHPSNQKTQTVEQVPHPETHSTHIELALNVVSTPTDENSDLKQKLSELEAENQRLRERLGVRKPTKPRTAFQTFLNYAFALIIKFFGYSIAFILVSSRVMDAVISAKKPDLMHIKSVVELAIIAVIAVAGFTMNKFADEYWTELRKPDSKSLPF